MERSLDLLGNFSSSSAILVINKLAFSIFSIKLEKYMVIGP